MIEVQMHYTCSMKTSSIPAVRVEPALRSDIESMLGQGETLSQFVENAVRSTVDRRKAQAEFVRRGLEAIAETKRAGNGIPADVLIRKLEDKLAAARALVKARAR